MNKKHFILLLALLTAQSVVMAQQPHNETGYNTKDNSMTSIRYGYGNTVERIIHSGKDQTSITVNSYGMPTEITNSMATVGLQYAGTSSVTVTQTVNGETKTSRVPLDSKQVLDYRAEYNKFKQNPSAFDKVDKFLAGGGAKMIGSVVDLITDKLENPIGACFEEALKAAQQTDNPIIPVSTLEALSTLTNLDFNPIDKLKEMFGKAVFDGYADWTQSLSDFIYKREMEKYNRQKEENRKKYEWRNHVGQLLLSDGSTAEEVAAALNGAKQPQPTKPGATPKKPGTTPTKPGTTPKKPGTTPKKPGTTPTKPGTTPKKPGTTPKQDDSEDSKGKIDIVAPQTPDDIKAYAKLLANKEYGGQLPDAIWVNYYKYMFSMPFSYMLKLNDDKKTYRIEDVSEPGKQMDYDRELNEPSCYMVIWYFNRNEKGIERRIPLTKGSVPDHLPR